MDIEPSSQSVDVVIQRQLAGSVLRLATLLTDTDDLRVEWYAVRSAIVGNREHVGSNAIDGYRSGHL